jgi:hypothetical protein
LPSLIEIGLLVLEKKTVFNINVKKYSFPYLAPPDPRGQWCEQVWIYIISASFPVNTTYSCRVVLKKMIF